MFPMLLEKLVVHIVCTSRFDYEPQLGHHASIVGPMALAFPWALKPMAQNKNGNQHMIATIKKSQLEKCQISY